jgi:hypothetical protein
MIRLPEADLARFADYAGFRYDLLAGQDGYVIENAPADFTGRVEAIRMIEYGRFGNVFYKALHAVALARQLGCHTVFVCRLPVSPAEPAIVAEGLRIVFRVEPGMNLIAAPTLAGYFFDARPFESALCALTADAVWEIVRLYLRPLFRAVLQTVKPVGAQTLVMSFRSGDVFSAESIHPFYVQPPASYYMKALSFARAELGVCDVLLVFEDDGNPAIGRVRAHLDSEGVPYALQSASVVEDFVCLAGARHLVAPYSTFAEAAAMLSCELESYFGFRNFESHWQFHLRQESLLLGVLRRKNARAILIDDAAGLYTKPRSWDRSQAQLDLLSSYPVENLCVLEGEEAEAREIAEPADALRRQLLECRREAQRLRALLIAARGAGAAADPDRAVRSLAGQPVTSPLGWIVRALRAM